MRKQFTKTTQDILAKDKKTALLLGDIGVFGFRDAFKLYPNRVFNIGILEQSTVSLAAGLSMSGLTPIIHTIAPFITERCIEQIKDDFGYQRLAGNIVSVGASYDYASLGCTHHCPADVPILKNIPEVEIVVPGTSEEFDVLFKGSYHNNKITYFRLSERQNQTKIPITKFGMANILRSGSLGTVIIVGPLLDPVLEAVEKLDVTIIYLTTIRPFDSETIRKNLSGNKVLICEPYYSGAITEDVLACSSEPLKIEFVGVPKEFLDKYGTKEEHDEYVGFTKEAIRKRAEKLFL